MWLFCYSSGQDSGKMRSLDSLLVEYCENIINTMHRSGFTGINVIEKLLHDPGISTQGSQHRVLFWHKNRRFARMSRAWAQIPAEEQLCLVVEYGRGVKIEDGQILTKKEYCAHIGHSCAVFDFYVKKAKTKLRGILKTYKKEAKKKHWMH